MSLPLDWSKDPVVLLEKQIQPVLHMAAEHLAGAFGEPLDRETTQAFLTAEALLASGGADFLGPADVILGKADRATTHHAATQVGRVRQALADVPSHIQNGLAVEHLRQTTLSILQSDMRPAVEVAIDVFRRNFIGKVLARQATQAQGANVAIQQLSDISRKIFFISVNASVEAARIGEAGQGVAYISREIRELSQTAQASTLSLQKLVNGDGT